MSAKSATRKECVNQQGRIATSWSVTWFAPIPNLFRPTDPSCVVHTGTRVALNAAGIAKYADTTVSAVADRAVKGASPHDNNAYWVKLRGALADYGNRNEHVANITEGLRSINTLLNSSPSFRPPPSTPTGTPRP